MRTFPARAPLFRTTVGFDHFDRLFDMVNRLDDSANSYPPYNIEKIGDDKYRIVMAVAGFAESELSITHQDNSLVVAGRAQDDAAPTEGEPTTVFLHRGIARRAFERRFELADTVKVTGAALNAGLLTIDLVREVPEAKKPRQIKIGGATIEAAAA